MKRDDFRAEVDAIAEQCIASQFRLLNRLVSGIYDEAVRPLGLKISQLIVLVAIAKMEEANPTALSEMLHMDISTLSRNVDRMRQRGWIAARQGEDGRTVVLSLTTTGEELLQSAITAWSSAQERATQLIGKEAVSMLHELTRSLGRIEKDL